MLYLAYGQDLSKPTYQKQTGTSYSGAQQHGAQGGQSGAPDSSYQFEDGSWSLSSDPSGEDEPVFTPVTDEDQVYAYKSRSRYNKKRVLFTQFHYTPTESEPDHGKTSQHKVQVQSGF